MDQPVTIGELARVSGVPAKTIRYYEQVGVLPQPRRSPAGYRQYGRRDMHRLLFMRRARALGLSLRDLKALTAELDNGQPGTMRPRLLSLVQTQLQNVQQQIAEFQLLHQQLEQVMHRLQTGLPSAPAGPCQCLDPDDVASSADVPPPQPSVLEGEIMTSQSSLETFTILSTPSSGHDGQSGCGCGCGCIAAPLPHQGATGQRPTSLAHASDVPRAHGQAPEKTTPKPPQAGGTVR